MEKNWWQWRKKVKFIQFYSIIYSCLCIKILWFFIIIHPPFYTKKKFVHRLDFTSIELTWQLSRGWMWMWIWNFINGTRKRRVDRQENLNKFPIPLHPSLKMSTRLTFFSLVSLFVVVVILFWFSYRHLSTFDAIKWKRLEAIIFWWD